MPKNQIPRVTVRLAGVLMALAMLLGVTPTALASVADGAFCEPVGWTLHWKAKKFYDGEFQGYGPLRLRRSTAWRDCDAYVS